MKLLYAYLGKTSLGESSGVIKKIKSQVYEFRKKVDEVYILALDEKRNPTIYKLEDENFVCLMKTQSNTRNPLKTVNAFIELAVRFISQSDISVIYIRYERPNLWIYNLLKEIDKNCKSKVKSFVEVPTFPVPTFKVSNIKLTLYHLIDKVYRKKFINKVNHFFVIGMVNNFWTTNFTEISNGINVKDIKLVKQVSSQDQTFNILGVARLERWHGYDRVIEGLKKYYQSNDSKTNVYFHIIGDGPRYHDLQKLVKDYGIENFVIFHGLLEGNDMDKIYNICNMAVSVLGMHRVNSLNASPLKTREYCSKGIPFLLSYNDTDLTKDFKFCMNISSDDKPVPIRDVIKFYNNLVETEPSYSILMRNFAEENMSWESKIDIVLDKIKELQV